MLYTPYKRRIIMKKQLFSSLYLILISVFGIISCDSEPEIDNFNIDKPTITSTLLELNKTKDSYNLDDKISFTPSSQAQIRSVAITNECVSASLTSKHSTNFTGNESIEMFKILSPELLFKATQPVFCRLEITATNHNNSSQKFTLPNVKIDNNAKKYLQLYESASLLNLESKIKILAKDLGIISANNIPSETTAIKLLCNSISLIQPHRGHKIRLSQLDFSRASYRQMDKVQNIIQDPVQDCQLFALKGSQVSGLSPKFEVSFNSGELNLNQTPIALPKNSMRLSGFKFLTSKLYNPYPFPVLVQVNGANTQTVLVNIASKGFVPGGSIEVDLPVKKFYSITPKNNLITIEANQTLTIDSVFTKAAYCSRIEGLRSSSAQPKGTSLVKMNYLTYNFASLRTNKIVTNDKATQQKASLDNAIGFECKIK